MASSQTPPPQLSDEVVNALLDDMNWQDDDIVEEKLGDKESTSTSSSSPQEIQEGADVEAVTIALEDMIKTKSSSFAASTLGLMERSGGGADLVLGGSSGDASIKLDVNMLLSWEKINSKEEDGYSGNSNDSGGSNKGDEVVRDMG